jgi:oligopeptide/dipeptide ABC transporter ATP-binding protein
MKGPSNTLYSIPGTPPNLVAPPSGCRFHPRCIYADSVCRQTEPELIEIGENHYVSCHKPMEKNMIQEDKNV